MGRNGWFTQWLRGCARLWQMHRRNRRAHLLTVPAAEQPRPWPPENSHPDFGNHSVATPRLTMQDLDMQRIVGDAIFGVAGPKPTKGVKTVVTYEDDSELVVYEKKGHVRVFLDYNREMDGNDAVVVQKPVPVPEVEQEVEVG